MTNRISVFQPEGDREAVGKREQVRQDAIATMERAAKRLYDPEYDIEAEINRTAGILGLLGKSLAKKPKPK